MNARGIFVSSFAVLSLALGTAGSVAHAQDAQSCQPGIGAEYAQAQPTYDALIGVIAPELGTFTTQLHGLTSANYATLLSHANSVATSAGTGGRIVVTLPDGTVVVDTSKGATNTFANFQAKTINENHNSRIAILAAQEYPCSIGIERKFSSTLNTFETTVAVRLGDHLSSDGTVRISK